ncbi:hypothetical protein [Hymenobacter cheonanensis]|uniref:hypothetical protein n=1 Tax=Hymenobacter sp. CA2-7 TaxID=3063993 RepID=UPI002712E3C9|nr:hypothetical protein [Hymenobacter sp. CA2-7]MDO7885476.1 hypothetical protein [Hymenobacter sp. CA2-7]
MSGCKPREEELQTTGGLAFSADTVKFDTVFTTLRTVTKRLWVYNRNPRAVSVDLVSLDNPATSPYTLIINGDLKQTANNLYIRGNDSLLILVRAQLKDNGQNGAAKALVVQENLNFRTNGQDQHVLLRSFGQNIYLHTNVQLPCNAVWTSDRPHVLYGSVVVGAGCTLRIKPGARIYAHAGAALIVQGTLLVNDPSDYAPGAGATDTVKATNANIVRFVGDRSGEAQYTTAPGQWTGIVLAAGSQGNVIRYAQIQNATIGVLLYNPDNKVQPSIDIQNTVIRYISGNDVSFAGAASSLGTGAGVFNIQGKVTATNTLFSDCYEYAVLGLGGSTALNFCTVANFPATGGVRKTQSLTFTDVVTNSAGAATTQSPVVSIQNSVAWGAIEDELYLERYDNYKASVSIRNSVLKTQLYAAEADVAGKPGLNNPAYANLVNKDPLFVRPLGGSFGDYRLGSTSPAYKHASPVGTVPDRDLLNLPRTRATPSLGAYESTKK